MYTCVTPSFGWPQSLQTESTKQDIFGKKVQGDMVNKPEPYPILKKGTAEERKSLFTFESALFIKAFYKQAIEKPNNLQDK